MEQQGKKTSQWALLKRVLGYTLKQYQFCWLTVVVCIFITAMTTLVSNLFMQSLIDDYILPLAQAAAPDFGPLAGALLKLAAVLLVGILCSYAYNRIMVNVTQGTMKRLRVQLFQNMESLPIQYFDTHPHGDIMSVYTNDTDTLRQLISQSFPQLVNSAISLISAFLSMAVLDLPLTLVSLCMVGVMLLATMKLSGLSGRYFVEQQRDIGALNGYIEEMMEGQKVVKVFCHEERSIADFTKLNQKLRESTNRANAIANMSMPINANLGNISYVLCAVIGAALALGGVGGLTIGTLVAFLNLNKSFTQPVTQISQQVNSVVMATAGARRIFGLMDERPEKDQGYVTLVNVKQERDGSLTETAERTGLWAWRHPHQAEGTVTYTKLEGDVVFDGVDFGYTDEKMVLHDVKLHALPGQKIALVGSTGAGKTTITNLINRFYDIQDGKIRFDGINVTKIKKDDLRRSLGIVLQDTSLFTGTVMDNIRYGRLDAPDEECIAAAKLANADGFIRRLPQGYQTVLTGGGANLSQGQRQLLSIARAAVADPPVLILDEATSSIDTHTEKLVQRGMDALMTGRTSFVIAHRLSTVKDDDRILVLESGKIAGFGTHEELLEQNKIYREIVEAQTQAGGDFDQPA